METWEFDRLAGAARRYEQALNYAASAKERIGLYTDQGAKDLAKRHGEGWMEKAVKAKIELDKLRLGMCAIEA